MEQANSDTTQMSSMERFGHCSLATIQTSLAFAAMNFMVEFSDTPTYVVNGVSTIGLYYAAKGALKNGHIALTGQK